jgi:peptide deformylase
VGPEPNLPQSRRVIYSKKVTLEILKYPDPRLKEISRPVSVFDDPLRQILDAMAETMYSANGVGLAAPQVGELKRMFVIDIGAQDENHRRIYEFINPKLSKGEGRTAFEEGCLSVPGISEEVTRKAKILVEYQDRFGHPRSLNAEALLAVAIQHENDHLDGILFVDRLSPLKRRLVKRRLSKVTIL